MANRTECSTSFWMATQDALAVPRLTHQQQDAQVDVCIVGAGIAGLSCAYELVRAGKTVMVLDDGEIGGGVSGRTTGHLTAMLDDRYFEIARLHGARGAQYAAQSHATAIDRIAAIVEEENIDCDFARVDGYLFVPVGEATDVLEKEVAAAVHAGLDTVAAVTTVPLPFNAGPALRLPAQAQFHILKYLNGLGAAILRRGGQIFTGAHVVEIEDGSPATISTDSGIEIAANDVIVATNTPINNRVAIHTKQAAYRTYVIGMTLPRGTVQPLLAWDTCDPYHYIRLAPLDATHDLLIVGGEDHKTGQDDNPESRYERLETWTRKRFALAGTVEYRWSGQIMEPVDGMAFIGRNPGDKHIYMVSGDSGNGLTHGAVAGILLTDLIVGRENPWTALYDPGRVRLRAGGDFIKETLNMAAQYGDWARGGDVATVDEIARGEGAVIRDGLHKVAVYRDETGALHERSATCPHLGCVVNWNSAEKTWDCPCHGSRFDCTGRVVNGPAIRDLAPMELRKQRDAK